MRVFSRNPQDARLPSHLLVDSIQVPLSYIVWDCIPLVLECVEHVSCEANPGFEPPTYPWCFQFPSYCCSAGNAGVDHDHTVGDGRVVRRLALGIPKYESTRYTLLVFLSRVLFFLARL